MIRLKTEEGTIAVDNAVYTNIAGYAATNCFGVKGMAVRSMTDGLVHLLRKEAMGKGVRVTFQSDNSIAIDLHIMVDKGVNIRAISASIIKEVRRSCAARAETRASFFRFCSGAFPNRSRESWKQTARILPRRCPPVWKRRIKPS